jgi:hypothetical protein
LPVARSSAGVHVLTPGGAGPVALVVAFGVRLAVSSGSDRRVTAISAAAATRHSFPALRH